MDVLKLLAEARAAGLVVQLKGDQVEVTGPKSATPIVHRLMQDKSAVVAALLRQSKFQRLWERLSPGERYVLDLPTGRIWSEFPDGSMRVWREFHTDN